MVDGFNKFRFLESRLSQHKLAQFRRVLTKTPCKRPVRSDLRAPWRAFSSKPFPRYMLTSVRNDLLMSQYANNVPRLQGELRWEPSGPKSNPRWTPPGIEIQHVCGWRCLTFGFQPQFGLKESENPLGNHTITECRSV